MNHEDLTRLARWVIPGWVTITLLSIFVAIDYALSPDKSNIVRCFNRSMPELEVMDVITVTALLAALSISLGFIIYQIYYYFRWNSPFSREGSERTPFFNSPGRMKESIFVLSNIERRNLRNDWVDHILFDINHKYRWMYIELFLYDILLRLPNGHDWLKRYRYRMEILHTLGASSVAIVVSFIVYTVMKISMSCRLWAYGIGYVTLPLISYFVIHWLMDRENNLFRVLYTKSIDESRQKFCETIKDVLCDHINLNSLWGRIRSKFCLNCSCYSKCFSWNDNNDEEKTKESCCLPTSIIKVWHFIIAYPVYMLLSGIITIFFLSGSIIIKDEIIADNFYYFLALLLFVSVALILWILVHKDYKPTIIPNIAWFLSIIGTSLIIIETRKGMLPLYHLAKYRIVKETFMDNGFILNLLVFIFSAVLLSTNRSSARLEVISLVRYMILKYISNRDT